MRNIIKESKIRVGILGAFRGEAFAKTAKASGMKLVAICDNFQHRLDEVCSHLNVAGYVNFDEFIEQDFDAVVIAAPFHLHASFAKKALEHGKHVLSETSCNITLAEGVELYRLAQETQLCYMLAENYCYTKFNMEMKKLYEAGEIGEVLYAEGEYNHPIEISEHLWYAPGINHWRHQEPPPYYNTHALAPLMYITNTIPVEVSCSIIKTPEELMGGHSYNKPGFVILVRMDNGAIFRLYGGVAGHSCWYGLHGTIGAMESSRGYGYFGPESVRVWHEPWDLKPGQVAEKTYMPNWPSHAKEAEETGHGGGDFFVEYNFANAIRSGVQPYLNAYRGIMITNVGILAWKSAMQNGKFLRVPDIKNASDQEEMLRDRFCPYEGVENSILMPPEQRCVRVFTPEIIEIARESWKRVGYTDEEIDKLLNT